MDPKGFGSCIQIYKVVHYYIRRPSWSSCSPHSCLLPRRKRKNEEGIFYGHNPESRLEKALVWWLFPRLLVLARGVWKGGLNRERRWRARLESRGKRIGLDIDDKVSQCFSQDLASALNAVAERALRASPVSLSLCSCAYFPISSGNGSKLHLLCTSSRGFKGAKEGICK